MESLYILIPVAMLFLCIAIGCFMWAVNRRQFDDLERQGRSILFEREFPPAEGQDNPATTVETTAPETEEGQARKSQPQEARDDRR